MKPIANFEVIDHGIDHAQYFQGCGTAYTKFDNVVTGCGENAKEAFEDALDSIAQEDFDCSSIESSEEGKDFLTEEAENASVGNYLEKQGEEAGEDCELYYYVSIRWNEQKPLDTFTRQYIETALWSSTDNADDSGGEPLDRNYSIADIAPETLEQMIADCADFQKSFAPYIERDLSRAGHDFWLTRNGHGAGFWDGDWSEPYTQLGEYHPSTDVYIPEYRTVGDYLTTMSKPYGSFDLYVGDDGKIHGN